MGFKQIFSSANVGLLIAFAIPLNPRLIPILILMWFVACLLERNVKSNFKSLNFFPLIVSILFYILHFTGMIWTENMDSGWFDLEVKASFFLFPVIVFLSVHPEDQMDKLFRFFTFGCLTYIVFCVSQSLFKGYQGAGNEAFQYVGLSNHIHPTYASMYLNFSLMVLFFYQSRLKSELLLKLRWVLIVIFFSFLFPLMSRAGIIAGCIIFCTGVIHELIYSSDKKPIIIAVIVVGSFLAISTSSGLLLNRFTSFSGMFYSQNQGSSDSRKEIWINAWELATDNIILGSGTGDVKAELIKKYESSGFNKGVEKKLNAHNQFLQSWISCGILALFSLIGMCVYLFSISDNKWFYRGISLMLMFYMLFESILETQAGVIFTAFIISLSAISGNKTNSEKQL